MNSVHFGIRDTIAAAIAAVPQITDGGVKVGRRRPMPEAVEAQIYVDLDDSPASPATLGNAVEWNTRIRVTVLARDIGTDRADTLADSYMTRAYGRVMADPYLGGKALQTDPSGIAWRVEDDADTGLSACVAVFTVRHRAPRASVAA